MDRKYYQDNEFEQFLQEELKDHRMYPADDAWKNIRTQLQTEVYKELLRGIPEAK